MAITLNAQVSNITPGTAGLDSVGSDPAKKAAPTATAAAAPQVQVDTVVTGTANEDALRSLDAHSGGETARTARSNVGTLDGTPRIGAQARLDAVSTTVQGSGGAKA